MQHPVVTETGKRFDVDSIRKDFPLLATEMNGKPIAFLDSAASSQKPAAVINAIADYYSSQHANVHRGVYALSASATNAFEASRRAVQQYIGAREESQVIFTKGTTESINLVATGFERAILKPGDEVLISAMEHHSNIVPWQMACENTGATLKYIPIDDSGQLVLDQIDELLNERTKILALVHVSNALGTINPVEELIVKAHAKGIPVLLDGAQAMPHQRVNVVDLDVDFYAFSAHKMYGPTGVGVLYGKEEWLNKLPPYQGGGEMILEVTLEKTTYNKLPFKFEAGTPNIAGAIALHAAIDYLSRLSWDAAMAHEKALLDYATGRLKEINGLRIIGEAPQKASVISFVVDGVHPHDLGTLLDQQGIAVRTGHHCTEPLMNCYGLPGTVRASMGIYNTMFEMDRLADGVIKAVKMLK